MVADDNLKDEPFNAESKKVSVAKPLISFSGGPEVKEVKNEESNLATQVTPTKEGVKKLPVIQNSVGYSFAGNSLAKNIKRVFPKELIPTKITGYLILSLFLMSLLLALIQFPLGRMLSGNVDIEISVGYPWPFFLFGILEPTKSPLVIKGLILDLLLYVLVAYILEVIFNYLMSSPFMKSKKDRSVKPKLFRKLKGTDRQNTKKIKEPSFASTLRSDEEKHLGVSQSDVGKP